MEVLSVNYNASDAPAKFTQSIRATGFCVVSQHPIEKSLIDEAYADWQIFFSDDRKSDYKFNEETQDGYFPAEISQEYFQYYPWGKHPDFLGSATAELYRQMLQMAGFVLQWLEDHSPPEISAQFSMPLSEMIADCPKTLLRILNHLPHSASESKGTISSGALSDSNLITLLPAVGEMGLQAQKTSGEWYDVPCDHGSIIVNIADTLQMASQGYFPSTPHRIVNPHSETARKPRLSLPLFLHSVRS